GSAGAPVVAYSPSSLDGTAAISAGPAPRTGGMGAAFRRWSWLRTGLEPAADQANADAILHLMPEIGRTRRPQIIVVHDLAPLLVRTSLLQRLYVSIAVRHAASRAAGIIVTSRRTRDDLVALFGVRASRIVAVPAGVDLD